MSSMSLWAYFKSLVYKFCFGLGLATISYFSFVQVKGWIDGAGARDSANVGGLQEKVLALNGADETLPSPAPEMKSYGLQFQSGPPVPAPGVAGPMAQGQDSGNGLNAAAQASPSPSPGADAPANDGSLPPENQNSEMPQYAMPYGFDPSLQNGMPNPNGGGEGNLGPAFSGNEPSGGNPGNGQLNGQSNGQSIGMIQNPISAGSNSGSGYSPNSNNSGSSLNSQDLSLLTMALKGMHSDSSERVSGPIYTNGTQTGSANQTVVQSSRWTATEGLSPDVAFAITGTSASSLNFHVALKLQAASGTYQTFVMNTGPRSVEVRTDFRAGHPFRVFDFQLANLSVRSGEVLRQVSLRLTFDLSSPSNPQVGTDSVLSFLRTSVQSFQTPWNFNSPSALPTSDPVIVADQLTYVVNIEKSP